MLRQKVRPLKRREGGGNGRGDERETEGIKNKRETERGKGRGGEWRRGDKRKGKSNFGKTEDDIIRSTFDNSREHLGCYRVSLKRNKKGNNYL